MRFWPQFVMPWASTALIFWTHLGTKHPKKKRNGTAKSAQLFFVVDWFASENNWPGTSPIFISQKHVVQSRDEDMLNRIVQSCVSEWPVSMHDWWPKLTTNSQDFVGNDGYLSLQFPVAPRSCICMLYSLNAWSEEEIEHAAQQKKKIQVLAGGS